MDLNARTLDALDWPSLQRALSEQASTARGARAGLALGPLEDVEEVELTLDAVEEFAYLARQATDLQLDQVGDVSDPVARAGHGEVLAALELRDVGATLAGLAYLARRLREQEADCPVLSATAEAIVVDPEVRELLSGAFDEKGELSGRAWPALGDLREGVAALHRQVREVLEQLIRGDDLEDVLQDRYVTMRQDRYVIPVKAHAKRWDLGIVHGTSGTGATVYVEPRQVVEINNRLRLAEAAMEAEERRILALLSRRVGEQAEALEEALGAAAAIDLIAARYRLAQRLGATRPLVGEDGVIALRAARHPVLLLRGVAVVPNDLHLDTKNPVLVLTGPNTGGKTVAMKTVGAAALLARAGCFVPAAEGSRVDFFDPILADIGDTQSVQGDLSSFSGHLMVLQEMLELAGDGGLFLLDEIATGTDPAQGAALARAYLEALAARGPRVVVTTHYATLKGMATADPRFGVAAMEYRDGRPTYRAVSGAAGESHGLATAERLGMDPRIVARARAVMDNAERELSQALAALDAATNRATWAEDEANKTLRALQAERLAIRRREERLAQRAKALEEEAAEAFRRRLRKAEQAIGQVVAQLQANPSHSRALAARAAVHAMEGLQPAEEPPPAPPPLIAGARVRLRTLGKTGEVVSVQGKRVTVRSGAIQLQVSATELEVLGGPLPPTAPVQPPALPPKEAPGALEDALRTGANTLDMRGMRAEEAMDEAEAFFDRAVMSHYDRVFLLHGHGTGALKQTIRRWLPTSAYVGAWAAALPDQGGDAYTVVSLRTP
ncbi:MAG: Smr/MutS family protein [Deltaproteobacteria bacterium]|nr:Smr/MutS family protein [Deltaproteobacteria bacterium]